MIPTCVERPDLRLAWDRSAVRFGLSGFADVTSHEQTTKGVALEVGNGPWPETADSNVLHIGRCGGGCELPAGEDDWNVAPPPAVVKHFLLAVDNCPRTGRDSGGQGRKPRTARAERN